MYYHIGKTDADKTQIKITGLREDTEYLFRVVAENKVGTSPALETQQPIVPKRKLGMYDVFVLCTNFLIINIKI